MSFPVYPARHYWDPVSLLNIDISQGNTRVTCMGQKTRYKEGSCCFKPEDPESSGLVELIDRLRQKPPQKVTADELYCLAWLCLCRAYHRDQSLDISTRWYRTVTSLSDYNDQATWNQQQVWFLSSEVKDINAQLLQLQGNLGKLQKVSLKHWHNAEDLRHRLKTAKDTVNAQKTELESANAALRDETKAREAAELEATALRAKLAAAQNTATESDRVLKEEVKDKDLKMEALQLELAKQQQANEDLRTETTKKEQLMRETLTQRECALQICQTELGEGQRRTMDLEQRVSELRATEMALRASISACWLHTAQVWLSVMLQPTNRYLVTFRRTLFGDRGEAAKFPLIARLFSLRG